MRERETMKKEKKPWNSAEFQKKYWWLPMAISTVATIVSAGAMVFVALKRSNIL
nr:MAG TPA: hypothetical protein [Caudoviricetes sp.]